MSVAEIRDFEMSNGVLLPGDFVDYLLHANGFNQEQGQQDENGFNFWPLEKVMCLSVVDGGVFAAVGFDDFFVFADYLDFSWAYAIRLGLSTGNNEVAIVGTSDGQPQIIANSFSEFVRLYLMGDSRLLPT